MCIRDSGIDLQPETSKPLRDDLLDFMNILQALKAHIVWAGRRTDCCSKGATFWPAAVPERYSSGWRTSWFTPRGFPGFEFGRAHPVAGKVSLVNAGEGFLGGGDELLAVIFDH